jgi:serine/threonine protein kinase
MRQLTALDVPLPAGMHYAGRVWEGGHSWVILVFHEASERQLVLKRPKTSGPEVTAALIREADIMQALHHAAPACFINVVGCNTDDANGPWLLMEYAEGGSLRERLDAAKHGRPDALSVLPFSEGYRYICQVARALDAAHDIGIVLRDIKPANQVFRADGSCALTDMGIACRLLEHGASTIDDAYTPKYASPELARLRQDLRGGLTPSDDLLGFDVQKSHDDYAANTVAYEMFAGRAPFSADSAERIGVAPPDPRQFNPALGPQTAAALQRGVAEKRADRPSRQWEFAVQLGQAMVAEGLLSENQRLDAQAAAPGPSRARIRTARDSEAVRQYADDPTVTRPPRPTGVPSPRPSTASTRRDRRPWGRRVRRTLNGIAVGGVVLGAGALVAANQWGKLPAPVRHSLSAAHTDIDRVLHWARTLDVLWLLLAVAAVALMATVVWKGSPRLFLGVLGVALIALGLGANTQREPLVRGVVIVRHHPHRTPRPHPRPQPARHRPHRKTATAIAERHPAAAASSSRSKPSAGGHRVAPPVAPPSSTVGNGGVRPTPSVPAGGGGGGGHAVNRGAPSGSGSCECGGGSPPPTNPPTASSPASTGSVTSTSHTESQVTVTSSGGGSAQASASASGSSSTSYSSSSGGGTASASSTSSSSVSVSGDGSGSSTDSTSESITISSDG